MDHDNIYTSILPKITESPITSTLSDVIEEIRSGKYSQAIQKVRKASEKERQTVKQQLLPAFFPTLRLGTENILNDDAEPSGIVQFDLDLKDNDGIRVSSVRIELLNIPELIYLFESPSGGLKFGLLTDFKRHRDESIDSLKSRYKQAYQKSVKYILSSVSDVIVLDPAVGNIKYACYFSDDRDIFFNPDCKRYRVDEDCFYEPVVISKDLIRFEADSKKIEELLSFIPRDLDYPERLPINIAVISELGSSGINLLESHWITSNRLKLSKDLKSQLQSINAGRLNGGLGALYNLAKKNGFKSVTGKSRKFLAPEKVSQTLEPLLSPKEAEKELRFIVDDFFKNGQSYFVNFSTGAGKTYTLLKVLEELDVHQKVLYLVKTHELAEEIVSTFNTIRFDRNEKRGLNERIGSKSRIDHLLGRERLCENNDVKENYANARISIPVNQCEKDCPLNDPCAYNLQFNNPLGNIRLMTHNEYYNESSKFFSGVNSSGAPSSVKWIPDFIIVDENIIEKDGDLVDSGSRFKSIKQVISDVNNGLSIRDSITKNRSDLLVDGAKNIKPVRPQFVSSSQYISDVVKWKDRFSNYSELLENLVQFLITEDECFIHGLRGVKSKLIQSRIKKPSNRHLNIPTLYLDATADPVIVNRCLGDVIFRSIKVASKENINVYQLSNKSITQKLLSKKENLDVVISGLKELVGRYKNPGLITYKRLSGNSSLDFDEMVARELDIKLYDHFGNLRGVNKFNEVDCLIILGRYCVDVSVLPEYFYAIFNEECEMNRVYRDSLVRMKDGSVVSINSQIHSNSFTRSIYNHFSLSETQQALGRGRLVHGSPKDIYYLCNEYLGSDIEIKGFVRYEDLFKNKVLGDPVIKELKQKGFLRDIQSSYYDLGFTQKTLQINRKDIGEELLNAGFERVEVEVRDRWRKKSVATYWISDLELLKLHLESSGVTLIGASPCSC